MNSHHQCFTFLLGFSDGLSLNTTRVLPAVEQEVQSINSDTSILPGYNLQYNIHRLHEVSNVSIREIHHTLLSLLHTFRAGWPDFKMAASINVLAFSRRYHRRRANASVEKYTEQLKGLVPVYSSNGNVQ